MNHVCLVGRLTRDPEYRNFDSGSCNCSFSLAINRTKTKDGQQEADFINCVAWNKTAELIAQYVHKGNQLGVEGRIQTRNYENQQGQRVYATEVLVNNVTFVGSRDSQKEPQGQMSGQTQQLYQQANYQSQMHGNGVRLTDVRDYNSNPYANPYGNTYGQQNDQVELAPDDSPF